MKTILLAGCVSALLASSAMAGNLAEPMMAPEVIAEESAASSQGFVIPLLLVALLAAVLSSSDAAPVAVIDD